MNSKKKIREFVLLEKSTPRKKCAILEQRMKRCGNHPVFFFFLCVCFFFFFFFLYI